jgi:type IV secretion system protein VirD4
VKRDLELPKEVGSSRWHPLALLTIPIVVVATNVAATQVVAARLGYNPTLGRPLAHVAGVALYANPLAWAWWSWRFLEPLGGFDYVRHVGRWPAVVYAGLWALPYIFLGGFLALFLVPAIVQFVLTRPAGKVEQLVDSAHFAEVHELRDLLEAEAGPVIGSFRGRLLRYAKALGINYTGPSGDGKSAFLLISNLLTSLRDPRAARWDATKRRTETWGEEPSFVVFDPTGEVFEKTARYQRDVLGKRIYRLDPLSAAPGLSRFNPAWSIKLGTEDEQQGCRRLMADIIDPQGKGLTNFWDRQSSTFAEAVLAKVGYRSLHRNDPRLFSLPGMIDYIDSFPKLKDLCDDMLQAEDDPHGVFGWTTPEGKPTKVRTWIFNAANTMKGMAAAPETQRNVFDSVVQHLAIYRDEGPLRRAARESTFSFSTIANEDRAAVVYIAVHPLDIPTLQQYLRTVTRAALREIVSTTDTIEGRTVRGNRRATIIALDEVATLGRLDELELLSGYLRKFGVMLWLFWQQTSQLARLYPDESFTENLGVHIMGRSNTPKAAKAIAESAGQSSATLTRRNVSGDRWTPTPLGQVGKRARRHYHARPHDHVRADESPARGRTHALRRTPHSGAEELFLRRSGAQAACPHGGREVGR